jgi:hypothetical protein
VFHPESGLIAGMLELERDGVLERRGGELRFLDLVGIGSSPRKHGRHESNTEDGR